MAALPGSPKMTWWAIHQRMPSKVVIMGIPYGFIDHGIIREAVIIPPEERIEADGGFGIGGFDLGAVPFFREVGLRLGLAFPGRIPCLRGTKPGSLSLKLIGEPFDFLIIIRTPDEAWVNKTRKRQCG
jgi:hypothetical protein